jgi:YD repeat-containing protein
MKRILSLIVLWTIATSVSEVFGQSCGGSPGTITISAPTSGATPSIIALSWTHTGFTGTSWGGWSYQVRYKKSVDANYTNFTTTTGKAISVTGLTPGVRYDFQIFATRPCNVDGSSTTQSKSGELLSVELRTAVPAIQAPASITQNSFRANWNTTGSVTQFFIDVSTSSSFTSFVINNMSAGTATSLLISSLTPGTTYFYRVRAANSAGTSANSGTASAALLPQTPTAISFISITANSIRVAWSPSAGTTSYRVDVGTNSTFTNTWYEDLVISSTSTLITDLPNATLFYFRIRAVSASGIISENSAVRSAKTLTLPPTVVLPSASTKTSFTVSWNKIQGAMYYQLDLSKDKSFASFEPGYNNKQILSGTSYNIPILDSTAVYYYRLRAVNDADQPSLNSAVGQASPSSAGADPNSPFNVNIIPPSPEAASLAKYADIPVNLYSGTPDISIPLYTVKDRELSLPLSVSYHAAGNKVETTATRIGLGWTLNAGGVITRTIRGRADEYGELGFLGNASLYHSAAAFNTGTDAQKYERYQAVVDGCRDSEPDLFYFNVAGYSGKFMFDWDGKIKTVSGNKIQIEPIGLPNPGALDFIKGWKITVDDGTTFTFLVIETVRTESSRAGLGLGCQIVDQADIDKLPSSWYLSEMRSANQVSWISFIYEPYTLITKTPAPETLTYSIGPIAADDGQGQPIPDWNFYIAAPQAPYYGPISPIITTYTSQQLRQITTSSGQCIVDFTSGTSARTDLTKFDYDPALNINFPLAAINVRNVNNKQIAHWDFDYTYTTGRLTLSKLTEKAGALVKPPYQFSYFDGTLPNTFSFAQDQWGFLNGNDKLTMVPALTAVPLYIRSGYSQHAVDVPWTGPSLGNTSPPTADRSPDASKMLYGMLKQITYPTGGKDVFVFEPHDYNFEQSHEIIKDVVTKKTKQVAVPTGNASTDEFWRDQVSITITQTAEVSFDAEYVFGATHNRGAAKPGYTLSGATGVIYTEQRAAPSNGDAETTSSLKYFTLTPGTYTLLAEVKKSGAGNTVNVTAEWVERTGERISETRIGGGIRIAKLTRSFGNGSPDRVTNYNYKMTENGVVKSSGSLLESNYVYGMFTQHMDPYIDRASFIDTLFYAFSQNRSALGTTQGSHVGYRYVTVTNNSGTNGKTKYHFSSPFDTPDAGVNDLPFPPALSYDYKRGLLLEQFDFNVNGDTVRKLTNRYLFYDTLVSAIKIGWRIPGIGPVGGSYLGRYAIGNYSNVLGYSRLNESKEKIFSSGTSFETVQNFTFNETTHKQLVSSSTINSKGETIFSAQKYPLDYSSTAGGIVALKTKKINNVPLEKLTWKKTSANQLYLLSGIKTNYGANNNRVFPTEKAGVKVTNPILTTDPYATAGSNYETRIQFTAYDSFNNLKEHSLPNGTKISYQWDYTGTLPTAMVQNAASNTFFFESFEEALASTSQQHTGKKSNIINGTYTVPPSRQPAGTGNYILSYWSKEGIDPWTYREMKISNYTAATVVTTDTHIGFIDDVRLYPENALMTTYTYEPLVGLTSVTDPANMTIYYEYDDFGRLILIRDLNGDIMENYDYQFNVAVPFTNPEN